MKEGIFAHWPNRITMMRFVGSLVLFLIRTIWGERAPSEAPVFLQVTFWLFILTVGEFIVFTLGDGEDWLTIALMPFVLAKAFYELRYELNNRPDWLGSR